MVFFAITLVVSCSKDKGSILTTIPNGDFELWGNSQMPLNWQTNSCPLCTPPYQTYIVQKDSAAYHGIYAAKFIDNHIYAAVASNKFSVSTHPVSLIAYAKCKLYGTDTVSIKIKLFKKSLGVDSGQWYNTVPINNYVRVVIPISQHSLQIDSVLITIKGGHQSGFPTNTTEFWVDNLILQ